MNDKNIRQLQKHLDKLKYYKLMRRKIMKKIRCEVMAVERITHDKHFFRKQKKLEVEE